MRTSYREMLEAHYLAISPKPCFPWPKGPLLLCESCHPVLPLGVWPEASHPFLQRQQSCGATPGRASSKPAVRQHLLREPASPCCDANAPPPARTVDTEGHPGSWTSLSEARSSLSLLFASVGLRLTTLCVDLQMSWRSAFQQHVGDKRGLSGRCAFCSSYKLLLSKTNEIGLLKDSRGVEVTLESTLSIALNRTMTHLLNLTILYCHPLEGKWVKSSEFWTEP